MLKKTPYYIKSQFSSARKRKLVKTTQFNQVTFECHGTVVLDKTVSWLLEKSTENVACLPCWHLAWWNLIDIRNGKKYCELHKKYVNRVKSENYSPTLKSRHKMALHRNVSSTKIRKNTALTSGKVYRKSSLSTMLALGMVKFYQQIGRASCRERV